MLRISIFSLFVFLLTNCSGIKKENLEGNWTAIQLTEEGEALQVNLEEITLSFAQKGYIFTSTLNYKESGVYTLQENYLITKDTINQPSKEKVVELTKLNQDSLFIRMNEAGKERILVMLKN